jgi:hypothetical protein
MSTLKRVSNRHLRRKIVNNTKLALSGLIDTVTLQNNTDNFCITSHPINPIYNLNENNEGRSEYSPLSENLIENNSLNYFVLRQRRHEYSQLKVDKARESLRGTIRLFGNESNPSRIGRRSHRQIIQKLSKTYDGPERNSRQLVLR